MGRASIALALSGLVLLGFGLRALGLEIVFPGDGSVVFLGWDSYYHARRALWSLANFPSWLAFDPYLNFPDGAAVPWPPLYDLFLAAVGSLPGLGPERFDAWLAWAPPLLGALTVLPVYAAARALAGRATAVGAAALFAVLPASTLYSGIGNVDHHAAVSLLSSTLLALALHAVALAGGGRPASARRWAGLFAGLALARIALVGTWPGSSLFVAMADGAILLSAAFSGRRAIASAEAASALAAAAVLWPLARLSPSPIGGSFSLVELSLIHPLALALVSGIAAGLWAWLRWRPAHGLAGLLRLAVLSAAALGVLAALAPGGGSGIAAFLGRQDPYAAINLEQVPLARLVIPGSGWPGPLLLFGLFYWLVGPAWLVVALRLREPGWRGSLLLLLAWSGVLGVLAFSQVRFAVDFAPASAILLALFLADVAGWLVPAAERRGRRRAVAVGLAVLALAPAFHGIHAQRVFFTWSYLGSGALSVPDRALLTHEGTLHRFAEQVRDATPPSAGFLEPGAGPQYGLMAFPGLGHVLHHVGRRALPGDNFGHYVGPENYFAAERFFELEDEAAAVAEAERLRTPWIVTADLGGPDGPGLRERLHRHDGNAGPFGPRLARMRLVTEGPRGGRPIGELFGRGLRRDTVPYKLFQVVEGARIVVAAEPGVPVRAELALETPLGRRFVHRAATVAGADGTATLRLPYATRTRHPVQALGPWRIRAGRRSFELDLDDGDVEQGATRRLPVGAPGAPDGARPHGGDDAAHGAGSGAATRGRGA